MLNDRLKLIRTKTEGVDARVDEVLSDSESSLAKLVTQAETLSRSTFKRSYIEASLLCEEDVKKVAEILELSVGLVSAYRDFIFDTYGMDRLTKLEHISGVEEESEKLLKMWALSHGLEFIAWRLGKKVSISPIEGLTDLFSTCIFKSKEAMFNGSSTEASKESVKWTKLSTDIARLLKLWVMDSSAAKKDLEIAIREVIPEFEGLDSILTPSELSTIDSMQLSGINEILNKKDDD